jgi:hypothetical protein
MKQVLVIALVVLLSVLQTLLMSQKQLIGFRKQHDDPPKGWRVVQGLTLLH